jgi:hypothetical protein
VVSGATNGGTLLLSQTAVGGKGGNGEASGTGGDATSTLTLNDLSNATQSAVLDGTVSATGGQGGNNSTGGIGGSSNGPGGNAAATLTLMGSGQVSATGLATGGQGGTTVAGVAGNGGTADAEVTAITTGTGLSTASATALGGVGPTALSYGGKGGNATANANASGHGPSTATATAIAGNDGSTGKKGNAIATANSFTTNGRQATAHATGVGGSGIVSTFSETSGGIINSVKATTTGQVGSTVSTESRVNVAGNVSLLDKTGLNSYALATGLPGGTFSNDVLSTHPNISAAFGASGASVLGVGAEGGLLPSDANGVESFSSEIDWLFDTTNLSGHLLVGLLDLVSFGTGFDSLQFTITKQGVTVLSDTFTSLSIAEAFFSDHVLDLGDITSGIALDLGLSFKLIASSMGAGLGTDFIIGAAESSSPSSVPEPATLVYFAIGILVLLLIRSQPWLQRVRLIHRDNRNPN